MLVTLSVAEGERPIQQKLTRSEKSIKLWEEIESIHDLHKNDRVSARVELLDFSPLVEDNMDFHPQIVERVKYD